VGDALIARLRPSEGDPNDLLYSTYLGGGGDDRAEAIAIDSSNSVYITGYTSYSNFPVTASNAYQTVFGGGNCYKGPCGDVFIVKLEPDPLSTGVSLSYSSLFGGSNFDLGHAIALDAAGFVYVAGETASTDLPLRDAIQNECFGGCTPSPITDVLLAKFDLRRPGKDALVFSTYLGGSNLDTVWGLTVDADGNMYVTGQVFSMNFPTMMPFQSFCNNCSPFSGPMPSGDAFLAKVCTSRCPAGTVLPAAVSFPNQNIGSASTAWNVEVLNSGSGDMTIISQRSRSAV